MEVLGHSSNEFVGLRGREVEDGKCIHTIVKRIGEEDLFVRKVVLNLSEVVQGTGSDSSAHKLLLLNIVNTGFSYLSFVEDVVMQSFRTDDSLHDVNCHTAKPIFLCSFPFNISARQ